MRIFFQFFILVCITATHPLLAGEKASSELSADINEEVHSKQGIDNEQNIDNKQDIEIGQWDLSVKLGYGNAENPIGGVKSQDLYLIPSFSYYGERFFVDNTTLGYNLVEDEKVIFDLVARLNSDGIYFNYEDFGVLSAVGLDSGRGFGMWGIDDIERHFSYMGGAALNLNFDWGEVSTRLLSDISNVHGGYEFEVSLFSSTKLGDWQISAELLSTYKSRELINYYYQIKQNESIIFVGTYTPNQSANNIAINLAARKAINQQWTYTLNYKNTKLSKAITNSPIIENNNVALYFAGVEYQF